MDWNPIDTAPRTRELLILFDDVHGNQGLPGYWASEFESWMVWTDAEDSCCDPTHWMPFPRAPFDA